MALYHRAESLYERGDLAAALNAFEQAYGIDPQPHRGERVGMHFADYDPEFQIARIQARLGRFREAKMFFDRCAVHRYTERSENAEEYRRWRAIVDRAVTAPNAAPLALPTVTAASDAILAGAGPVSTPPPTVSQPGGVRGGPLALSAAARRTAMWQTALLQKKSPALTTTPAFSRAAPVLGPLFAPDVTPAVLGEVVTHPASAGIETATSATRTGAADSAQPETESLVRVGILALVLLGGVVAWRLRHRQNRRPEEGLVSFGRYAMTGLLGVGRYSFVYDARDRKTGQPVALRIRRPELESWQSERFGREAQALDRVRRLNLEGPVAGPVAHGFRKVSGQSFEYLVLERLCGKTLLDLSRNALRRLEPVLCIEILREVAAALRKIRTLGLSYLELDADDIFIVDPVPISAGNIIKLRLLGLCPGPGDPCRDAVILESIAAELFRGRVASWEQDEWVVQHVPVSLRNLLVRARESRGTGASFEEVEQALQEATSARRRA